MLKDDEDIIRGLGFVTLYAAYLEEQVDDLLAKYEPVEEGNDKKPWQISHKIHQAKELLKRLHETKFEDLEKNLDECKALFAHRNELVHGRIYGGTSGKQDILKSGRPNTPDREVKSSELYELATKFFEFFPKIYRPWIPEISKALNSYKPKTENRKPKTGF